jgi:pimeloyl-ACP methyl ester carboxylesterase
MLRRSVTAPNPRRGRPLPACASAPARRRGPAAPSLVVAVLAVALGLLAAGCISSEAEAPASAREDLEQAGAPIWSGEGDFYMPPDPLPLGKPGDLIRVDPVEDSERDDVDTFRVMYHTRSKDGADIAATGLIFVPRGDVPEGGWPIVASLHGTDGMVSSCAPSRNASRVPLSRTEPDYVVAAPDYTGLGPTGQRHPYISGIPEGRSTIDLVRAVHRLATVPVRDEWVAYGLSQGGHAAVFTAEIAPTYAPELDLRGVIALAPVGDLNDLAPYVDSPQAGLVPMFLFGLAADNPDLDPAEYLSDAAMARADVMDTSCTNDILTAYREDFTGQVLLDRDPSQDPDARLILEANSPGRVRTPVPVLILHGIEDPIVPTSQSVGVFERQCALGVTVQLSEYQGSNHTMVLLDADDEITTWIAERFAGDPAPTNCPGATPPAGGTVPTGAIGTPGSTRP